LIDSLAHFHSCIQCTREQFRCYLSRGKAKHRNRNKEHEQTNKRITKHKLKKKQNKTSQQRNKKKKQRTQANKEKQRKAKQKRCCKQSIETKKGTCQTKPNCKRKTFSKRDKHFQKENCLQKTRHLERKGCEHRMSKSMFFGKEGRGQNSPIMGFQDRAVSKKHISPNHG
jgi:hypothetical protein